MAARGGGGRLPGICIGCFIELRPASGDGAMSRFSPVGSLMRSISSSVSRSWNRADGEPLLLIDCPKCQIPVVQLRSKKTESYGRIFYKCPNNFMEDETCGNYWWEANYVKFLRGRRMKELQMAEADEVVKDGAVESEELKRQLMDMKQQMMEMKQQIWDVKQQIGELMQHIVELKQQLCQGKVFIVNNAVLAVVGIVIGLVVAIFCK
ncbi:GRF zinc finger family protein [Panicum miliaceum]|uniref:GRF zinc finger family protein n=1 Tax=Panicum miliaceum TaxID=4540 RepID=A0A3L6QKJ5_PANMI|nr:GRF zinc finger family protein [Panicum miliaceum]